MNLQNIHQLNYEEVVGYVRAFLIKKFLENAMSNNLPMK